VSTLLEAREKSGVLVEALPWFRAYRGKTVVVKIGGEPLKDEAVRANVVQDIALLVQVGVKVILVHGAGPQITEAMAGAGLKASFIEGLRVTDDDTMEIIVRELMGSINMDLVLALSRAGLSPVGMSGADGGILEAAVATTSTGQDLGRVGKITNVRADVLNHMLDGGFTPVVASLAPHSEGKLLNVNADEVADAVAAAVQAEKLAFLTNVDGLYENLGDGDSLISEITGAELGALLPRLSAGMVPKARSALNALDAGVQKVHLLDGRVPHVLLVEIFTDEGIGTQVVS
jgi:acetylglutamate kinase